MADLLALSSRIIDSGVADEPVNRVTQELSEVADGIAVVESFSHVVSIDTGDGLVCFDASGVGTGAEATTALRTWRTDPVDTLVYTHGHVDHVGGSGALLADARERGHRPPRVAAHEAVAARFDRYRRTDGWNRAINARQFGGVSRRAGLGIGAPKRFLPDDVAAPTTTFAHHLSLSVGGTAIELRHGRGETDDHLWAWLPASRAICAGDFVIWNFPNAGNPQKVQRYPLEWAQVLREMASMGPELLLPAHGLPIGGADRVALVLGEIAAALETLVADTLALMNDGASLDTVLHEVRVGPEVLERPWLRPLYDEPEFVVRNIWRLYGGWWDGDPSSLKPAPRADVAREVATLAGGALLLARRAGELADAGDLRLACHLAELAADADPTDAEVHEVRARVYQARRDAETSLMAKGIYAGAARESRAAAEGPDATG
ncbi:MAG TPA: alkyl sulfatase dimerization domain-containing protein [Acidimicrobiales bacterium]|nr:alkyl sulfatase dimerization domain-containing protein [Acidimicrobiales bacterium]